MPIYNPYQYYNPYQQQQQQYSQQQQAQYNQQTQQQQQVQQQQAQAQIQNGGLISVQSEDEARAWIVAPGNSVTFKNENAPYCYTKTMGFSPLDQPRFEKYRLVKEEDTPQSPLLSSPAQGGEGKPETQASTQKEPNYARVEDMEALKKQINELHKRIARLERRREENDNE